jgi:hypothetical protein
VATKDSKLSTSSSVAVNGDDDDEVPLSGDILAAPLPGGILAKKGASRRAGKEGSVAPVKIKATKGNKKTTASAGIAGNGVGVAALNNGAASMSRRKPIELNVDVSAAANATSVPLNDDGSIDLAAIGSGPSSLVAHKKNRKRTRAAKPSRNAHKKAMDAETVKNTAAFNAAAAAMDTNNDDAPSSAPPSKKKPRREPTTDNNDDGVMPPEESQPVSKGAFKKLGKSKK